jgi:hypothetical protein
MNTKCLQKKISSGGLNPKQDEYSCLEIPAKYRFAEHHYNEIKKEYYKQKKLSLKEHVIL